MGEPFDTSPESRRVSFASLLLGVGLGALVGVTAAILLAPKSGTDTREDIVDLANRVKDRTEEMITEVKKNLDDISLKSRELVEHTKDRVETAIQAGKDAAQEKRHDLEAQIHTEETT